MSHCYFDLHDGRVRRRGTIIKNNDKTVLVQFIHGANKKVIIKRHKQKHNVIFINET